MYGTVDTVMSALESHRKVMVWTDPVRRSGWAERLAIWAVEFNQTLMRFAGPQGQIVYLATVNEYSPVAHVGQTLGRSYDLLVFDSDAMTTKAKQLAQCSLRTPHRDQKVQMIEVQQ